MSDYRPPSRALLLVLRVALVVMVFALSWVAGWVAMAALFRPCG